MRGKLDGIGQNTHIYIYIYIRHRNGRTHVNRHTYAHANAHSPHKLAIPSLRNSSNTPAFVSTRYSRHTCRDTSRMLSAHAQRLLFGLARFVKECFPSLRFTTGHVYTTKSLQKYFNKVEVFRTHGCTPGGWFQLMS